MTSTHSQTHSTTPGPSLRVRSRPPRAGVDIERLAKVPTSVLADAHPGVATIGSPLHAFTRKARFVGTALTVQAGSLAQWKALQLAQPGEVLVIACTARRDCAEFGAVYAQLASRRGIAAVVTDGLLRDRDDLVDLSMPVFACGTHPSSPADPTQGRIGWPVELQGVSIETGDVIVGDSDGLAIIPRAHAEAALGDVLERQLKREASLQESLNAGAQLPVRLLEALSRIPLTDN